MPVMLLSEGAQLLTTRNDWHYGLDESKPPQQHSITANAEAQHD